MLKELIIQNVVLIEHAHIDFEAGFNVLSGETGSGKSAVMQALQLALGGRSDVGLIRHQAERASVEAIFDAHSIPALKAFLEEKGIEVEDPSLLILKRELTTAGKSRGFINHQPVQLGVLRQAGDYLVELVSQHANHKLFSIDYHRSLLDAFGNYSPTLESYKSAWKKYQESAKKLEELQAALPSSIREIEICQREIEEIEEARLKEEEEEVLFQEYSFFSSAEERLRDVRELERILAGERGVLTLLMRGKPFSHSLCQKDVNLAPLLSPFPGLILEVEELIHTLRAYEGKLEADPKRLEQLNERLTLISRLKRKYGATIAEIEAHRKAQKIRLEKLLNLEDLVEELTKECERLRSSLEEQALILTSLRKKNGEKFALLMTDELHSLNMQEALFHIQIDLEELGKDGRDRVEFFLQSNVGERLIALREGASGGEMARVLLAQHVLLAEGIGTLIFDEIDANIGGTTAGLIGAKLQKLGKTIQIFSITHFPQMARFADHHIQISKQSENGRMATRIDVLSKEEAREVELARMVGA